MRCKITKRRPCPRGQREAHRSLLPISRNQKRRSRRRREIELCARSTHRFNFLSGVGPKRASQLASVGIKTVGDFAANTCRFGMKTGDK